MTQLVLIAFVWGCVSALSLPLGAWAGITWRPHEKVVSALMAFGAGALLFALTIELMGELPEWTEELGISALLAGVGGALAGGLAFDLLNQLLNNRGAFLRNLSNAKEYVARTKRRRAKRVLRRLTRLEAFRGVEPDELADLVRHVHRRSFADGEKIFTAGDPAEEIYFLREGQISITPADDSSDNERRTLEPFDSFGELCVLTQMPRDTTAEAKGDVVLYVLEKEDLRDAARDSAALASALEKLAAEQSGDWRYVRSDASLEVLQEEADEDLGEMHMPLEEQDFDSERERIKASRGVGMAIWLGIAIDAVPESLVIGNLATGTGGMSIAFVAGVFLANFPEAMSSAVSMRVAGFTRARVLLMWSSLCLLTGLGAALGAAVLGAAHAATPGLPILFIEGLAAGAMLTAIAETMLPEAFEQGGSIVGFATLSGFLTALVIASL